MRKRRVVGRNTRRFAMPVLRPRKGMTRRASCEEFIHHFPGFRVQCLEEVRFYINHSAGREKRVEHALQLDIRHGLKDVEKRLAKTAQGLKDLFGFLEVTVIGVSNRE